MVAGRWVLTCCALMTSIGAAPAAPSPKVIVLIGGDAPHNPNVHDARQGIERLRDALSDSPDVRRHRIVVRAYPDGWPPDEAAFDDAATIVWYFDGLDHHPLLDPSRRTAFTRLMAKGVGLVAFHQAFTLPPDDRAVPLATWLGAVRHGMVDRTVERITFTPARHPIANGVRPFTCRDEYYPSLDFAPRGVTPILTADLHREAAPAAPPTRRTVAWAFDRPGGGRAFGFSGFHYLDTLDHAEPRTLMLNAILWTAGVAVPAHGVRSRVTWETAIPSTGETRCAAR